MHSPHVTQSLFIGRSNQNACAPQPLTQTGYPSVSVLVQGFLPSPLIAQSSKLIAANFGYFFSSIPLLLAPRTISTHGSNLKAQSSKLIASNFGYFFSSIPLSLAPRTITSPSSFSSPLRLMGQGHSHSLKEFWRLCELSSRPRFAPGKSPWKRLPQRQSFLRVSCGDFVAEGPLREVPQRHFSSG